MRPRVGQDKVQRAELAHFVEAIPVRFPGATAWATIAVGESLLSGSSERV